ncbi:aconitase family protein, partial [Idiomarina abyssalis]
TLERRARKMEEWLENPELTRADKDADYSTVIEIDLNEIKEPIVCCPNDPDDAKFLSEVAGDNVDEVFIGSCMTNIGHFRAAGKLLEKNSDPLNTRLWIAPPTKMDKTQLEAEGYYDIYERNGVRTEMPGCSLCMGNQARVEPGATVLSTSTRNFPNRLGDGANVYLTSAELAAVGAIVGRLPTPEEYLEYAQDINSMAGEVYKYLNFDQMDAFRDAEKAAKENIIPTINVA